MGSGASKKKANLATTSVQAAVAFKTRVKRKPQKKLSSGPKTWKELLGEIADYDLWDGVRREDRNEWKAYLEQAEMAVQKPRKPLPQDVVDAVIDGQLIGVDLKQVTSSQNKVIVFISSTFTDTKAERNLLMRDVYPYLRTLCRRLGMDFGTVDMRWGVKEEVTLEHGTTDLCLREVDRCIKESSGPAFLCILGHKYGYRPFPAEIEQSEFEKILSHLEQNGEDTALLKEYFRLDHNSVPLEYILRPRKAEQTDWWTIFEKFQEQLRQASVCLSEDGRTKYFFSVTENEIHKGLFENQQIERQGFCLKRKLKDIETDQHRNAQIIDLLDGKNIDEDAQTHLTELREVKINQTLLDEVILEFNYEDNQATNCVDYIRDVCDSVCKKFATSILSSYEEFLHVADDEIFQEVAQHKSQAAEKSRSFVGRNTFLQKIDEYICDSNQKKILCVYGRSGCGKTSIMAVAANKTKERLPKAVLCLRFLGTTARSGTARGVMFSLCSQITRAYGKDIAVVPSSFKELIVHFQECLAYATQEKPLVIFLDSLDQLTNEDYGRTLKWLSLGSDLPDNVHFVVSTLPIATLDIIDGFVPPENLIEVTALTLEEAPVILDKMLGEQSRVVSDGQKKILLDKFTKCPLPLFLRLSADIALTWHSYDEISPDEIADDMPGLITKLYEKLELKYGRVFVHHALAYITAAKSGLSISELEDILSCDDPVLDEIFEWWVPPFRRIPQFLWARIRHDIGGYLVERGVDGVNAYGWYHRQFWETAEKRYLHKSPDSDEPFAPQAHGAIADYFDGKWAEGKIYTPTKPAKGSKNVEPPSLEDRQVPKQPIVLSGSRQGIRQLNRRKLSELPYQLIQNKVWDKFEELVYDLKYIEAKFESQQGYECLSELMEATKLSGNASLRRLSRFVGSYLSFLLREPVSVYQVAAEQTLSSPIRKLLEDLDPALLPKPIIRDQEEQDMEDPCEMTLQGHKAAIRMCDFSKRGDLIVSSSDDTTMRIWDAITGAELVTITGLPSCVYPPKSSRNQLKLQPVNPACFSNSGELIGSGTEEGNVILWDTTGAQIHKPRKVSTSCITYVAFSHDDKYFGVCDQDSMVKIFDQQLNEVTSLAMNFDEGTSLDFSHDGTKLAVSTLNGLVMINTSNWSISNTTKGRSGYTLCIRWAPNGKQLASGGDDSMVALWNPSGTFNKSLRSHRAWIWSVLYTKDSRYLFSCSSDRSLKLWDMTRETVIATLGGHSHRVSMASLNLTEDKFVTCSLDQSVKVWDFESVKAGKVPATGGLHYSILKASKNGTYVATCQGWSKQCGLKWYANGKQDMGNTCDHTGFLSRGTFTQDECILLTVDFGHTGEYSAGAVKHAAILAYTIRTGNSQRLAVDSPTCVSCGTNYIVAGTDDGKVEVFSYSGESIAHVSTVQMADKVVSIACSPVQDQIIVSMGSTSEVYHVKNDGSTVEKVGTMVNNLPSKTLAYKPEEFVGTTWTTSGINYSVYSATGKHLVTGHGNGAINVYDVDSMRADAIPTYRCTLLGHTAYTKDLEFSSDGQYLLSCGDLSMRVWDSHDEFRLTAVYYGPVNCATFLEKNVLLCGEATGNMKKLKF